MSGRVSRDLDLSCDCGARGIVTVTEDDIHERKEGAQNVDVAVYGPFERRNGGYVCLACEAKS